MIDYDGLLKKIPKVKKILDDGSNSNLYHYTKPEKLLNILESETIRFSNALYLNDKEEVTYSYKLIGSLIDEMPGLNSELFSRIKEHFHRKYKNIISGNDTYSSRYEYYTISFSTDSDNLTLWNNYSKGQSYTGYNIGFCKKDLIADMQKQGFHSVYGNIIYNRETQITILKLIFEKWNRQFDKIASGRKTQRNIEKQQTAHLQRGVCGLEELLGGLQRIEVVHPVAGADYSVLGPVQRELAHVLLHKGYLQRRPSRLFGGYPQHVPGYVHAGHDVPRPGQTQRYRACAAGAVRHPQLFSAQKPEQVFRPGIVIHVLHERVVHAREITVHQHIAPLPHSNSYYNIPQGFQHGNSCRIVNSVRKNCYISRYGL